jgi:hypothetical protein
LLFGARDLLAGWLTGVDVRPRVIPESEDALRAADRAIAAKPRPAKAGTR